MISVSSTMIRRAKLRKLRLTVSSILVLPHPHPAERTSLQKVRGKICFALVTVLFGKLNGLDSFRRRLKMQPFICPKSAALRASQKRELLAVESLDSQQHAIVSDALGDFAQCGPCPRA